LTAYAGRPINLTKQNNEEKEDTWKVRIINMLFGDISMFYVVGADRLR
jgi:hypothetical protein